MRIVRSDDHDDEIRGLDAICFAPEDAYPVALPPEADTWVALENDHVVGYLVALADSTGMDRTRHYLDRYGVHPEHAGKGVGKRLCRAWLRHAKQRPGWAWTYTYVHNAQSINALIHAGFRAWQAEKVPGTDYPPQEKFCLWQRAIS